MESRLHAYVSHDVFLEVIYLFGKLFSLWHCSHRIVSAGYYGFCFIMPMPTPQPHLQYVQCFHYYCSNEKSIRARLLKCAGYIHNHNSARSFVRPLEQRVLYVETSNL